MKLKYILFAVVALLNCGCYSFKGISISPDTKTFAINPFLLGTSNTDQTTALKMQENLKLKILQTTRLSYGNQNPDIDFTGNITNFQQISVAPDQNNQIRLMRFEMTVSVQFKNNKNEKDVWEQQFTRFVNFDATQNFENLKDGLIKTVSDQIVDDIFNKAFANW